MKIIRWTILFLALASFAAAQSQFQYIVSVSVKPGMAMQYEDFLKKLVEGAEKNGDAQSWFVFQPISGAPGGQYRIVLPHENWGAKDSWTVPPELLTKAFGEEEAMKILRAGSVAVQGTESVTSSLMPPLSVHADRSEGVRKFYIVSTSRIRSERAADYIYGVQKIREAEAEMQNSPRRVSRRLASGDRNVFTTVTGYDSGAERDKWPRFSDTMSNAYSSAEIAAIMEKVTGASAHRTTMEIQYRPDLSNSAAPSAASN